jgi:ABC-type polysaccharide/polyol phosphate export permease
MIVLIFFIFLSKVNIKASVMYGIVILIEITIFAFGVSLILSSLYLKFRDLSHLWGVILQIGFWGTPIIYPVDIIPEKYHLIFILNPMARYIGDFRTVVIAGQLPGFKDIIINFFMGVILFLIGLIIFQNRQRYFAEWI